MSNEDIRRKAISVATLACDQDKKGNYEEAFTLYKQALKAFFSLAKRKSYSDEPSLRLKRGFLERAHAYVSRAKQLRTFVTELSTVALVEDAKVSQCPKSVLKHGLPNAITVESPRTKWSDLAGLCAVKRALEESILMPRQCPEVFSHERSTWKGILLYGLPGTGKSSLVKACASEAHAILFTVNLRKLVMTFSGESSRHIRSAFEQARQKQPAIVFIDEIEEICSRHNKFYSQAMASVKTELLQQMHSVQQDEVIHVLAATNQPWDLDAVVRRRFQRRIYVPLPNEAARKQLFQFCVGTTLHALTDDHFAELARMTGGYSGSDIKRVVESVLTASAKRAQIATDVESVELDSKFDDLASPALEVEEFYRKLYVSTSSVNPSDLILHQRFTEEFEQTE